MARVTMHWETVTPLLREGLIKLMSEPLFAPFRLVGGTSLSLQLGHRMSVDIDLFTDASYESIDFQAIHAYLLRAFNYVSPAALPPIVSMGMSYIIGSNYDDAFKLDLYYTDDYIRMPLEIDGIRMASQEDIIAMKIDIVQRGGRKKDFWDLHQLLDNYSIAQMITLHEERYPYGHDAALIKQNFIDFSTADEDLDPICLKGKHWELIKLDITEVVSGK